MPRKTRRQRTAAPVALARERADDEFRSLAANAVTHPRERGAVFAWSLEEIRAARDDQIRGKFRLPVRMAEAMRTNAALFVPFENRIDALGAIAYDLIAHPTTRGLAVHANAKRYIATPREVLRSIASTLVNHGVAIGQIIPTPNAYDSAFTSFELREWPLEFVDWDYTLECYVTQTRNGPRVPIVHGDGQWVVFKGASERAHTHGCILPAALTWGSNSYGFSDWNDSARTHGLAKMMGELPENTPLTNPDGSLTVHATAFLQLMKSIIDGEEPVGIRPPGSKTEFVSNSSTAWQIFQSLVVTTEKAAARIYLGTDAILGSVSNAPGVDVATLFGVATTKIQNDLTIIESALNTGVYQPWTAVNYGDSKLAPRGRYLIPDPDADKKAESQSKREEYLMVTIERRKSLGMSVNQAVVDQLAGVYGVVPAPQLANTSTPIVSIQLAQTDIAKVVKVSEARASQGLTPLGNEKDELFVSELDALAKAGPAVAPAPAETPAPEAPAETPAEGP